MLRAKEMPQPVIRRYLLVRVHGPRTSLFSHGPRLRCMQCCLGISLYAMGHIHPSTSEYTGYEHLLEFVLMGTSTL